ncbi:hypothetical protein ES703_07102 [subsurface metagenome]
MNPIIGDIRKEDIALSVSGRSFCEPKTTGKFFGLCTRCDNACCFGLKTSGEIDPHVRMHGVKPVSGPIVHQDTAGLVAGYDGVFRVLFPMHQVRRNRHVCRPVTPGPVGSCMVVGVIPAFVFDYLIQGHSVSVVEFWPHGNDRLVLDVGPDLSVGGAGQPDALILALVEEVPCLLFNPGGRGAVGSRTKRFARGIADVEAAVVAPADFIGAGQHMSDVVAPFGEHIIGIAVLDDTHILDPGLFEDRIARIAGPFESIWRGGIAQVLGPCAVFVIPCVPKVVAIFFPQNISSLAYISVPGVFACSSKKRIALISD